MPEHMADALYRRFDAAINSGRGHINQRRPCMDRYGLGSVFSATSDSFSRSCGGGQTLCALRYAVTTEAGSLPRSLTVSPF